MSKIITLSIKCHHCGKTFNITMTGQQCFDYQNGCHVQEVFPDKSADERELLISGICGKCYDNIMAE